MIAIVTPTHDTRWLPEAWESLRTQEVPFIWVVSVNAPTLDPIATHTREKFVHDLVDGDKRVVVIRDVLPFMGVGARKHTAFMAAAKMVTGDDVLLELDHDDLLLPGALAAVEEAFSDPEIGFAYSDCADFADFPSAPDGQVPDVRVTYKHPEVRAGWLRNGHEFYEAKVGGVRPGTYEFPRSFAPSALSVGLVFYAPNHLRAWRASVYEAIRGHDVSLPVCDDHDLVARTYLATKFKHIEKPLYLYRIAGQNTWAKNTAEIRRLTYEVREKYLEQLVLRECALRGLPAYDLGSAISPRTGWKTVDTADARNYEDVPIDVVADLRERWPWEDNSVGAFRAADLLEHLPDREHTMREIHRCLAHGGWLLSSTPSTDTIIDWDRRAIFNGRGAYCDPTHVSFWNELSFHYWTRAEKARYIRNKTVRFMEVQLDTGLQGEIPYVRANLVALKDGGRLPGEKFI